MNKPLIRLAGLAVLFAMITWRIAIHAMTRKLVD